MDGWPPCCLVGKEGKDERLSLIFIIIYFIVFILSLIFDFDVGELLIYFPFTVVFVLHYLAVVVY